MHESRQSVSGTRVDPCTMLAVKFHAVSDEDPGRLRSDRQSHTSDCLDLETRPICRWPGGRESPVWTGRRPRFIEQIDQQDQVSQALLVVCSVVSVERLPTLDIDSVSGPGVPGLS